MDNPEVYVAANTAQRTETIATLKVLFPKLRWRHQKERVLEIGCGPGDITRDILRFLFVDKVIQYVATDKSSAMIDYARTHFSHKMIEYREMDILDITTINFPYGFSKVISFFCLHWVRDYRLCLTNVYQLLNEGGQTLLSFVGRHPTFAMLQAIKNDSKWKRFIMDAEDAAPIYQNMENPCKYFGTLAEEIGFTVERCQIVNKTQTFKTANHLRGFLEGINPYLKRIPTDEHKMFSEDCFQKLCEMCGILLNNFDKEIEFQYEMFEIILAKPLSSNP